MGTQARVCGTLASRGSRQGHRAEVTSRLGSNGSLLGERWSAAKITYRWMAPAASPREVPWVEAARHPPSDPLRLSAWNAASAPSRSRPPCRGQAEAHPVSDAVRWARSASCHRLFDGARCLAAGPATHAYDVKPGGGTAIRGRTVSRHRSRGEPMRFGTCARDGRVSPSAGRSSRRRASFIPLAMPPCGVASPRPDRPHACIGRRPITQLVCRASPQARPDRERDSPPTVISLRRAVDRVQAGVFHVKHPRPSSTAPGCVSLRAGSTQQLAPTEWLPSGYREYSRNPLALLLAGSGLLSHERAGKGLPRALTNRSVPWGARGPLMTRAGRPKATAGTPSRLAVLSEAPSPGNMGGPAGRRDSSCGGSLIAPPTNTGLCPDT